MGKTIKLNPKFQTLYNSDKRYFILTGGRGSGKTYHVIDFIWKLTYEVGHGILYTRYTMTSAERSIIPLFKSTLEELGIAKDFHITKTHIINKRTKSFIFFSGIKTSSGDQTANLKSLPNIDTWVIEEGEDYKDAKSFRDIDDSIRGDQHQNRVIWIQNPDTPDDNIIYQRFFKDYEVIKSVEFKGKKWEYTSTTHPHVNHIHTTYLENRVNLNSDKLAMWDKTADTNPELFLHKYIGGWLKDKDGALFLSHELNRFSLDNFRKEDAEYVCAFIDPADRGTDSLSMPIGYIVKDLIYITDWYFSKDNQEITIPEISFKTQEHKPDAVVIETNGLGLAYYENISKFIGSPTYPVHQGGNKHRRIISTSGYIRNYFVFRDDYEQGSHYDLAMRELFAYMKDDKENRKTTQYNDDAPDSLSSLWSSLKDLLPDKWL